MLTGTFKADWIQLSVERYLAALPTLKQSVIAGVFKIKGASPCAITRAEKLQISVFLPNELSLDDWFAEVYALPTVWPDVSMMEINNMSRVAGYDFHHIRKNGHPSEDSRILGEPRSAQFELRRLSSSKPC